MSTTETPHVPEDTQNTAFEDPKEEVYKERQRRGQYVMKMNDTEPPGRGKYVVNIDDVEPSRRGEYIPVVYYA